MSAISAGLGYLLGQITNPAGAGGNAVTTDEFGAAMQDVAAALRIVKDTMDAADRAARSAVTAATDAGTQIEDIGLDVKEIVDHTYQVVIPRSLSWLAGYLISGPIDQLRQRVAQLQGQIDFLLGWRNQIDSWRHGFVDPNLEKWVGFRQWFDGWPQTILFRWHDWLEHPDLFGQWAAAPVLGPLVAYLAAREHRPSRDNLNLILLGAWAEQPDQVMTALLEWAVS